LVGVPDNEPDAMIPAGPNVAVGAVWIDLSEPHYGIHGTSEPQTIGYASSNGCVRLTNWDVKFLSRHVRAGVPVEFRDISGTKVAEDPANATAGAASSGRAGASSTPAASGRSGSGASGNGSASSGRTQATGGRAQGTSSSTNRARTEQPKSNEAPKQNETPKAEDHSGHDEHAGHTP
ncbi:L,D-transpeptidase, partial [Longimicrobium sp.]|uniref:L,D-transpeptidase n=1 Tax=Longimicrobium sp. TaxID=2029185 RepID=UPI002E341937